MRSKYSPAPHRLCVPFLFIIISVTACAPAGVIDYTNEWRQQTILHVTEAYEQVKTVHPGPLETFDPGFVPLMEKLKTEALASAVNVINEADYQNVLLRFVNGFQDVHLRLYFNELPDTALWMGFAVKYTQGEYVVSEVLPSISQSVVGDVPVVGDLLEACDDKSAKEIYRERVLPFYGINNLEASLSKYSAHMTIHSGASLLSKLQRCSFVGDDGRYSATLTWRPIEYDELLAIQNRMRTIQDRPLDIYLIAEDVYTLAIPTFLINSAHRDKQVRYRKLLDKLHQYREQIRNAKLVVFDLRGNSGGYKGFAKMLIEVLWSGSYAYYYTYYQHADAIRASRKKIADLESRLSNITDDEYLSNTKRYLGRLRTIDKNKLLVYKASKRRKKPDPKYSEMKAPVVVLTDYHCMSACLMFLDIILQLPNVTHIGQATSADTRYTTGLDLELSKNFGELIIPSVSIRGRPRAENVPLIPSVIYPGDSDDTQEVEAWVLREFEAGRLLPKPH